MTCVTLISPFLFIAIACLYVFNSVSTDTPRSKIRARTTLAIWAVWMRRHEDFEVGALLRGRMGFGKRAYRYEDFEEGVRPDMAFDEMNEGERTSETSSPHLSSPLLDTEKTAQRAIQPSMSSSAKTSHPAYLSVLLIEGTEKSRRRTYGDIQDQASGSEQRGDDEDGLSSGVECIDAGY